MEQIGDTACGIAAGFRFGAVGIADTHQYLRRRMTRRLEKNQLIAANTRAPVCQCTSGRRANQGGTTAKVEDDKIVAQPMHLEKRHLDHGAAYMAAGPELSNAPGPISRREVPGGLLSRQSQIRAGPKLMLSTCE